MCGRFTQKSGLNDIAAAFPFVVLPNEDVASDAFAAHYNIAPTQEVLAATDADDPRIEPLVWGLVPHFATERSGAPLINARSETAAKKPSFRESFRERRCLVFADGFYEWQMTDAGKIPMHIRLADGKPFAFAGLWDSWSDPSGPMDAPPLRTCAILTTDPNPMLREIHDRMPVILTGAAAERWIDRRELVPALEALCEPYPADRMEAYPVSTLVNRVANDDPRCIERVAKQRSLFD